MKVRILKYYRNHHKWKLIHYYQCLMDCRYFIMGKKITKLNAFIKKNSTFNILNFSLKKKKSENTQTKIFLKNIKIFDRSKTFLITKILGTEWKWKHMLLKFVKCILLKQKFAALGDLSIKLSPPCTLTHDKVRSKTMGRERRVRLETNRTTRASKINQEKLKRGD